MTLTHRESLTYVVIDTTDVLPGSYTLVLESFDTNSARTLKIDTITIVVTKAAEGYSDTLAYFVDEL